MNAVSAGGAGTPPWGVSCTGRGWFPAGAALTKGGCDESRNLDVRDVLSWHRRDGGVFPVPGRVRKNLKKELRHDLPHRGHRHVAVRLPLRGSNPAGVVLRKESALC